MSAPTINQIREALAARLDSIPDTQASAYSLGNPTPPTLQIVSGQIAYEESFGQGLMAYQFKLQGLIGFATDIGAQKLLGRYSDSAGTYSVHAAILADPTLGGVVQHADIASTSEEQEYALGKGERPAILGREWIIDVLASGV